MQLFVREGDGRRCVVSLQSAHGLRWIVPEGAVLPLRVGSAGRILSGERRGRWLGADRGGARTRGGIGERTGRRRARRRCRGGEHQRTARAAQPSTRSALRRRRGRSCRTRFGGRRGGRSTRRWARMDDELSALEAAYLAADDPRGGSGFRGDADRWERLRRPIVSALNRQGTFLDVGCANGHLLECVVDWAAADGHRIEPFGLDVSATLVARAQRAAAPMVHPAVRGRHPPLDTTAPFRLRAHGTGLRARAGTTGLARARPTGVREAVRPPHRVLLREPHTPGPRAARRRGCRARTLGLRDRRIGGRPRPRRSRAHPRRLDRRPSLRSPATQAACAVVGRSLAGARSLTSSRWWTSDSGGRRLPRRFDPRRAGAAR